MYLVQIGYVLIYLLVCFVVDVEHRKAKMLHSIQGDGCLFETKI